MLAFIIIIGAFSFLMFQSLYTINIVWRLWSYIEWKFSANIKELDAFFKKAPIGHTFGIEICYSPVLEQ